MNAQMFHDANAKLHVWQSRQYTHVSMFMLKWPIFFEV
jgi:hypothetical protein